MKKHPKNRFLATSVIVIALSTAVEAETVVFGPDWIGQGIGDDVSPTETLTIKQDGVTFTLTITSASNNINVPNVGGNVIGVTGGSGPSSASRIDSGGRGVADDEMVTFTLSVSGAPLKALSLKHIKLHLFQNAGERVAVGDGGQTVILRSPNRAVSYRAALSKLTALRLSNVATWKLSVKALDPLAGATVHETNGGVLKVSFNYKLADPKSPSTDIHIIEPIEIIEPTKIVEPTKIPPTLSSPSALLSIGGVSLVLQNRSY